MDNYGKIKRALMLKYRELRFRWQFRKQEILEGENANQLIYNWLLSGQPGMIGRLGAVESRYIYAIMKKKNPGKINLNNLNLCAGVFPPKEEVYNDFFKTYTAALKNIDIFVAWSVKGGGYIYSQLCSQSICVDFFALEPFFYPDPWTAALENKNVLIVHPFAKSIEQQYEKRKLLFENPRVLPRFKSLHIVKAIQSNAEAVVEYKNWHEALDHMKAEIRGVDFDIAIIGAGAYGLPLASYIKSLGKQAIHMAGVTQMLFGIRGKRWDNDPRYHRFFNEHWIHPQDEERPRGSDKVEGGTYW